MHAIFSPIKKEEPKKIYSIDHHIYLKKHQESL